MSKAKPTYEEALKRLEEIASVLENGETPLEEAMKLYSESVELSAFCYKQLDSYKAKIEIINRGEEQ